MAVACRNSDYLYVLQAIEVLDDWQTQLLGRGIGKHKQLVVLALSESGYQFALQMG